MRLECSKYEERWQVTKYFVGMRTLYRKYIHLVWFVILPQDMIQALGSLSGIVEELPRDQNLRVCVEKLRRRRGRCGPCDLSNDSKCLGRTVKRLKTASRPCLGNLRLPFWVPLHSSAMPYASQISRSRVHTVFATGPDVYIGSTRESSQHSLGLKTPSKS